MNVVRLATASRLGRYGPNDSLLGRRYSGSLKSGGDVCVCDLQQLLIFAFIPTT
jgi:hypothetical protein